VCAQDERTERGRDRLAGGTVADRRDQGRLELLQLAVDQIFLGREVVEHGRLGHVGPPGYVHDRHTVEAVLGEKVERRRRDRLPGLLLLAFPQARLSLHTSQPTPC
jgi:hypothetical protein